MRGLLLQGCEAAVDGRDRGDAKGAERAGDAEPHLGTEGVEIHQCLSVLPHSSHSLRSRLRASSRLGTGLPLPVEHLRVLRLPGPYSRHPGLSRTFEELR